MFFQVEIDCDNDAFQNGRVKPEIRRLLEEALTIKPKPGSVKVLLDSNGNSVGTARFIDGNIRIH